MLSGTLGEILSLLVRNTTSGGLYRRSNSLDLLRVFLDVFNPTEMIELELTTVSSEQIALSLISCLTADFASDRQAAYGSSSSHVLHSHFCP